MPVISFIGGYSGAVFAYIIVLNCILDSQLRGICYTSKRLVYCNCDLKIIEVCGKSELTTEIFSLLII